MQRLLTDAYFSMRTELNLPTFDYRLRQSPKNQQEEIWDSQRKRWVKLTPEEWVRQHFVHFLISEQGFPAGCIGNELSIKVGQLEKRCDSVVFGSDGLPLMIIEYKAPTVPITQKVFNQISRYNITLQVDWLIVSNGLQHYCCHLLREKNQFEFLPQLPRFENLIQG